jgi:hypothetical protein
VDQWLSVLDELLAKPLPSSDRPGQPTHLHHIDLRVSRDFWDDETRDEVFAPILAEFEADRERLAQAITRRYGPPRHKRLRPYFDGPQPQEPGTALFSYLTSWFYEVDVWTAGNRGIVVEVGHADKEMPLQLMLIVGDLHDSVATL